VKYYSAYLTAAISVTTGDLGDHLPIASLVKGELSYSCAAVDKISTDSASHGPSVE